MTNIPSLDKKQISLDLGLPMLQQSKLKKCIVDIDKDVKVCCNSSNETRRHIIAIRNLVRALPPPQRVMSLDIEWDVYKNACGFIVGTGTTALIRLSYRVHADGPIKAFLLQTNGEKKTEHFFARAAF